MIEQERQKQAAATATVKTARASAQVAADAIGLRIAEWYEAWVEAFQQGSPSPFLPQPDMTAAAIANLPLDVIQIAALQAFSEGNPFERVFDDILDDASEFDRANGTIQARLNDIDVEPASFAPSKQALLAQVQAALAPGPISALAATRAAKVISNALLTGRSLRETTDALQQEIGSSIKGAATLISRDALYQYDGAVNSEIATRYNLTAYRYVGSIVKASRPQCERWVRADILTRERLERDIALLHRAGNPDGFRPETTFQNFPVFRGGWNCRHQAIPVRETA